LENERLSKRLAPISVPLASFDPLFEGRQHALAPDARFHPGPTGPGFSGLFSPRGQSCRCLFLRSGAHASTFLSPLTPRPLRRFLATMGTLTPRGAPPPSSEVSPLPVTRPFETILPPTTPCRPVAAFPRYPSARRASLPGLGFAIYPLARRGHKAESSSSSCGLVSHLRLLPTPPHGDAVTLGFRPESVCLERTCTSLNECACGRTDRRRPRRPSNQLFPATQKIWCNPLSPKDLSKARAG
jgi:hypothetical protein